MKYPFLYTTAVINYKNLNPTFNWFKLQFPAPINLYTVYVYVSMYMNKQ